MGQPLKEWAQGFQGDIAQVEALKGVPQWHHVLQVPHGETYFFKYIVTQHITCVSNFITLLTTLSPDDLYRSLTLGTTISADASALWRKVKTTAYLAYHHLASHDHCPITDLVQALGKTEDTELADSLQTLIEKSQPLSERVIEAIPLLFESKNYPMIAYCIEKGYGGNQCRSLIDKTADITIQNICQAYPLIEAIRSNAPLDKIIEMIAAHPAMLEVIWHNQRNALHIAVECGNVEAMAYLCQYPHLVHGKDIEDKTPLQRYCQNPATTWEAISKIRTASHDTVQEVIAHIPMTTSLQDACHGNPPDITALVIWAEHCAKVNVPISQDILNILTTAMQDLHLYPLADIAFVMRTVQTPWIKALCQGAVTSKPAIYQALSPLIQDVDAFDAGSLWATFLKHAVDYALDTDHGRKALSIFIAHESPEDVMHRFSTSYSKETGRAVMHGLMKRNCEIEVVEKWVEWLMQLPREQVVFMLQDIVDWLRILPVEAYNSVQKRLEQKGTTFAGSLRVLQQYVCGKTPDKLGSSHIIDPDMLSYILTLYQKGSLPCASWIGFLLDQPHTWGLCNADTIQALINAYIVQPYTAIHGKTVWAVLQEVEQAAETLVAIQEKILRNIYVYYHSLLATPHGARWAIWIYSRIVVTYGIVMIERYRLLRWIKERAGMVHGQEVITHGSISKLVQYGSTEQVLKLLTIPMETPKVIALWKALWKHDAYRKHMMMVENLDWAVYRFGPARVMDIYFNMADETWFLEGLQKLYMSIAPSQRSDVLHSAIQYKIQTQQFTLPSMTKLVHFLLQSGGKSWDPAFIATISNILIMQAAQQGEVGIFYKGKDLLLPLLCMHWSHKQPIASFGIDISAFAQCIPSGGCPAFLIFLYYYKGEVDTIKTLINTYLGNADWIPVAQFMKFFWDKGITQCVFEVLEAKLAQTSQGWTLQVLSDLALYMKSKGLIEVASIHYLKLYWKSNPKVVEHIALAETCFPKKTVGLSKQLVMESQVEHAISQFQTHGFWFNIWRAWYRMKHYGTTHPKYISHDMPSAPSLKPLSNI
jgi:hypothetical protein